MVTRNKVVVEKLLMEMPSFHERNGVLKNWHINKNVLQYLSNNISQGMNCLETGAGYSTCVLAALAGRLTTISPNFEEHKRISDWLIMQDVDIEHLTFIDGKSQNILPTLDVAVLDFVLIDGAHAFPFPVLDWYYSSLLLRRGGLIMIDDGRIKSVSILNDFLKHERKHWRVVKRIDDVVVYEKMLDQVHDPIVDWRSQDYNLRGEFRYWIKRVPIIGSLALKLKSWL